MIYSVKTVSCKKQEIYTWISTEGNKWMWTDVLTLRQDILTTVEIGSILLIPESTNFLSVNPSRNSRVC